MKDMISERLVQLSTAQESMMEITDIMDQWESSQSTLEKNTYDAINISDKVLNLSREGNNLITKLQESYNSCCSGACKEEAIKLSAVLEEMKAVFSNVLEASIKVNEISHNLEKESAFQKEIKDSLEHAVGHISESVDSAVACAEFMLAELYL